MTRDTRVDVEVDVDIREDIFILTITNAERSDAGRYRCETTDTDPDSRDVTVTERGTGNCILKLCYFAVF